MLIQPSNISIFLHWWDCMGIIDYLTIKNLGIEWDCIMGSGHLSNGDKYICICTNQPDDGDNVEYMGSCEARNNLMNSQHVLSLFPSTHFQTKPSAAAPGSSRSSTFAESLVFIALFRIFNGRCSVALRFHFRRDDHVDHVTCRLMLLSPPSGLFSPLRFTTCWRRTLRAAVYTEVSQNRG